MPQGDPVCQHCGELHIGCCYPNSICPTHQPRIMTIKPEDHEKLAWTLEVTGHPLTGVRPTWDEVWMGLALTLAGRSTCSRLQVGAVVVSEDNQRVLGVGYNGGAKGLSNDCLSLEPGQCGHLHAEVNALLKADYSSVKRKIMYVTTQPCLTCAVAIVNADIAEVVYQNPYRVRDGLDLLYQAKIPTRQLV